MASLTLLIMAAGIGSRYGGLKQIDPVGPNGEIVVDYSVYDALRAGFDKVVFIIRREIEDAFRERIGRTVESRVETAYVLQELDRIPAGYSLPAGRTKPWGTGHAILCARDSVVTPFAAINADDFYGRTTFAALAGHLRNAGDSGGRSTTTPWSATSSRTPSPSMGTWPAGSAKPGQTAVSSTSGSARWSAASPMASSSPGTTARGSVSPPGASSP
ncbi:MAG TPA: sugar phosphate nucleotidyltransferase [Acidobacteriota bacterium]|nr:sugar phosphate nucleotidyltransferase [Acidobacteriota bacterium]